MKKFTLLLCVTVAALCLPQKIFSSSSITVSGTTLTVNSDNAGWLSTQTKTAEMKACKTIILVGKFNESDLQSIQASGSDDFQATIVDMSNAQFVSTPVTTPSSYYWFKETATGTASENTHAFVGGDLYQLSVSNVWNPIEGPVDATMYSTKKDMEESTSSVPSYAKIPKYMYCQMHISTAKEWVNVDADYAGAQNTDLRECDLSSIIDDETNYPVGTIVKVKRYYKLVKETGTDDLNWVAAGCPTPEELKVATNVFNYAYVGAVENNLEVNYFTREGDYIFFDHYYKKVNSGTKTWIKDTDIAPTGETITEGNFDYTARNSNNDFLDETWVKMNNGYDYYQLVESRTWSKSEETSKTDVPFHFDDVESMNANTTAANGQYAIVGGTEKIYSGSWSDFTLADDYSQVKFTYWKSTIQTAICPNNVDVSQYPDNMLSDCSNLAYIDFGNYNATITSGDVTFSADAQSSTPVQKSDLENLFKNHGGSNSLNNKTVYYGDNINSVDFNDYTFTFSGSANDRTVVVTSKTGSDYAFLQDGDAKSTNNCKTIKFVGNFNTPSDKLSGHTIIDFSEANIQNPQNAEAYRLTNWTSTAQKLIFSEGEATISAADENGVKTVTILADNDDQYTTIKNRMKGDGFQEGTTSGTFKYEVRQALTVATNYDNPTNLVIGSVDTREVLTNGSSATPSLSSVITDKGANGYTTITFADGSVYTKSSGILDCSNSTNVDYDKLQAWIKQSGATVNEIKLGKYVSIVNGVTVIDNTSDTSIGRDAVEGLITNNLSSCTYLTNAEKKAIGLAENLKLNGKFTPDDFLGIKNAKSGADVDKILPTKLDLGDAKLSSDQRVPVEWRFSVTEIKVPANFYVDGGGADVTIIPEKFCEDFENLQTVTIPDAITKVGNEAFRDCHHLTTVNWGSGVHTIGESAFERCGFSGRFDVPNTIKTIGKDAFRNNYDMTYLYILSGSLLESIDDGAFFNDERYDGTPGSKPGLKEVHVECNKFIKCHITAFDDSHTNGHSDVGTAKCRLFYPAVGVSGYVADPDMNGGKNDSFQDYVGDFKAQCFHDVMTQEDLNNLKTIVEHGGTGKDGNSYGPYEDHGWFMFTSTGIGFTQTTTWRTYSEAVPFKVPRSTVAKFYLAWGCESSSTVYGTEVDANEDGANDNTIGLVVKLVQMNEGDLVPANTGVLINYVAGQGSSFSDVIPLDYVANDNTHRYDAQLENNQYTKGATSYSNYLRKINNEGEEGLQIDNVEIVGGKATYRNYFFGNVDQLKGNPDYQGQDFSIITNIIKKYSSNFGGWMFLRAESGKYPVNNKAYLHLPASMTGGVDFSTWDFSDRVDEGKTFQTRLIGIIITDGDETEQTDIKNMKLKNFAVSKKDIYTIQGQKVEAPAVKGIYIQNGKKIIVK